MVPSAAFMFHADARASGSGQQQPHFAICSPASSTCRKDLGVSAQNSTEPLPERPDSDACDFGRQIEWRKSALRSMRSPGLGIGRSADTRLRGVLVGDTKRAERFTPTTSGHRRRVCHALLPEASAMPSTSSGRTASRSAVHNTADLVLDLISPEAENHAGPRNSGNLPCPHLRTDVQSRTSRACARVALKAQPAVVHRQVDDTAAATNP